MKSRDEKKQIKIVYEEVEIIEFESEKEDEFDNFEIKNRFLEKGKKYVN